VGAQSASSGGEDSRAGQHGTWAQPTHTVHVSLWSPAVRHESAHGPGPPCRAYAPASEQEKVKTRGKALALPRGPYKAHTPLRALLGVPCSAKQSRKGQREARKRARGLLLKVHQGQKGASEGKECLLLVAYPEHRLHSHVPACIAQSFPHPPEPAEATHLV